METLTAGQLARLLLHSWLPNVTFGSPQLICQNGLG